MNNLEQVPQSATKPEGIREGYTPVDRKSSEVMEGLEQSVVYRKTAPVTARKAVVGEEVRTILSGETEPESIAVVGEQGGWVVTHKNGEQTYAKDSEFEKRYVQVEGETSDDGQAVYKPIGFVHAVQNQFKKPVVIEAKWKSNQYGAADCFFVDFCENDGGNRECEPYIIREKEFRAYYTPEVESL